MRTVRVLARTALSTAFLLTASLGGAGFAADVTPPKTRVLPDDLFRYAVAQGCEQVSDFYSARPAVKEPPYVYGVLQSPYSDSSAALWCETSGGAGNKYVLLLKLNDRSWPGGCADRIENQALANGLTVVKRLEEPLDGYADASTGLALTNVAPGQMASGVGIRSLYGNAERIFYCHQGQWVARNVK